MSNHHKSDSHRKQILHKINNDNIDAANREAKRKARMRAARNRRLLVFFVFALAMIGFLGSTIMNQNQRLEEKQIAKEQLEVELEEIQDLQENLKLQISKLDDDEYIAKLARKEYFLSEEGEIIFTIPDETDKRKEKDGKKDNEDKEDKE